MKVFLILLMVSCTQIKPLERKEQPATPAPPAFNYQLKNVDIYNGKVKFIQFATDKADGVAEILCDTPKKEKKRKFRGQVKNRVFRFYFAESYFSDPYLAKCFFEGQHVLNVNVREYNYPRESLNVPKRKVDLNKKDLERVLKEMEVKKTLYQDSADHFLFLTPFKIPLKSKITSYYGNQRIFNDKKKSQHLGNDLRAGVGVKIPATNRGRVSFVGDFFFSGKLVIIDHGLDIYTVYMHLSKILVKPGDIVAAGDIVALAGRTGRVSGPHLHWGVKINDSWVDGFTLVEESKKHFVLE
ncbi:MAG: hypothetical protein CME62_10695 [Halobacteriovoraceae bacterium]|nr:hypothetical protein [Halobacteriovoraceae bacterium]|tara:strand:- start:14788 stop:15681 length:894 start_codon:yes stop_codon:yes gene_type:complete